MNKYNPKKGSKREQGIKTPTALISRPTKSPKEVLEDFRKNKNDYKKYPKLD